MQFSDHRTNTSTSTTALVILVAATAVFLFVVSSKSGSPQHNQRNNTNPMAKAHDDEGLRSIERVDTDGLPANLPTKKVAAVRKNYRHDFGTDGKQRVLILQTNSSLDQLSADYRTWLTNHGFTIVTRDNSNKTISYVAQKSNRQLFVVISQHGGRQRVEINYVRT